MKSGIFESIFKWWMYQQDRDDTFKIGIVNESTEMEMGQNYHEYYIRIIPVYEKERYYLSNCRLFDEACTYHSRMSGFHT